MDEGEGAREVVIRNLKVNGALTLPWILLVVLGVALQFGDSDLSASAAGLLAAVLGAVLAYRTWKAAVRLDASGVTIRNALWTRSWRWLEVGEFAWDQPAWNVKGGPVRCVSVCPKGDLYTYPATTTACGIGRRHDESFREYAEVLTSWTQERDIEVRLFDPEPAVARWYLDPRARGT